MSSRLGKVSEQRTHCKHRNHEGNQQSDPEAGDLDNVYVLPLERNLRIIAGVPVLATVVSPIVPVLIGRAPVRVLSGICHDSKPL